MASGLSPNPTRSRSAVFAAVCLPAAIFCAKSFVINTNLYIGKSVLPADTTDYLWGVFALVLWALFWYTFGRRRLRPRAGEIVFGFLFGVFNYLGTSLFAYDSWAFIGTTISYAAAALKILGQALTMTAGLTLLSETLTRSALRPREPAAPLRRFTRLRSLYRNHPVPTTAAFLFLCWVPYMTAFYPGTVIYDMCAIVRELIGTSPLATWHCPFTMYVFGGCVWLGRRLGGDNAGVLIYMLLQSAAMAFALGCIVAYLRRLGAHRGWQAATLLFFGVVPIWGGYAMMIGKDTLYTATLTLFFLQTLALVRDGRQALPRARDLVAYGVTALLASLWRSNGLYVVLPSAILVLCFLVRGRQRLRVAVPLASAMAAALLFTNVLVPALGFVNDSVSAVYSLCFQQTARTVRNYGDQLTREERDEIDRVLDYDAIGGLYQPWISDPVKNTFRQYGQGEAVEKAALSRYFKTWASMLPKYPLAYFQAFVGNTSGYYAFTPKYDGITYVQQAGLRFVFTSYWEDGPGELHTVQPEFLTPFRNRMISLMNRWWTLPILSWLYVLPFYTWMLVAAGISLAHQRRWKHLAVFAPALFSFGVCLLSPVDSYLRYFLPIVAMTIPLLAFVAHPARGAAATENAAVK